MAYHFMATHLQALYGQNVAFDVHTFEIQPKNVFPARAGLEAYGVQVVHKRPSEAPLKSFLKIFRQDVPQRHERTKFLIGLGLAKNHEWIFQGVPYGLFPGSKVNGVELVGHLTMFLGLRFGGAAKDVSELRDNWDNFSEADRRAFASHLASAVSALEKIGLVHGDVSPNNIMIGPGPGGRQVCCLCDFDGFNHKSVPRLPRKFDKQDVRPLGSRGYQYRDLIERIEADSSSTADIFVETDRFAMAALIFEMMVWSNDTSDKLIRGEILDQSNITGRTLNGIPSALLNKFSAGVPLLEKALTARSIGDIPSPNDWLVALGVQSAIPAFTSTPMVMCKKCNDPRQPSGAKLTSATSDLGKIDQVLADVRFVRKDHNLNLSFSGALPVAVRRPGVGTKRIEANERKNLAVSPGDTVVIGDWEITFDNSP